MARLRYSAAAARDLEVRELRLYCREVATRQHSFPLHEELGAGVRLAVYGAYLILLAERDGAVVIERVVHGARDQKGLL